MVDASVNYLLVHSNSILRSNLQYIKMLKKNLQNRFIY